MSGGPVTLSDLTHDNRLMWTYYRDCGRERDLDPASIPLPLEYPAPQGWQPHALHQERDAPTVNTRFPSCVHGSTLCGASQ